MGWDNTYRMNLWLEQETEIWDTWREWALQVLELGWRIGGWNSGLKLGWKQSWVLRMIYILSIYLFGLSSPEMWRSFCCKRINTHAPGCLHFHVWEHEEKNHFNFQTFKKKNVGYKSQGFFLWKWMSSWKLIYFLLGNK